MIGFDEPSESPELNALFQTLEDDSSFGAEAYLMEKISEGELDLSDVDDLRSAASLLETACKSLQAEMKNGSF